MLIVFLLYILFLVIRLVFLIGSTDIHRFLYINILFKTLRFLELIFFIMFKWFKISLFISNLFIIIVIILISIKSEFSFLLELIALEFWVSYLLPNFFILLNLLLLLIILFINNINNGLLFFLCIIPIWTSIIYMIYAFY